MSSASLPNFVDQKKIKHENDSDVEPDETTIRQEQQQTKRRRRRRGSVNGSKYAAKKIRRSLGSANAPPRHVHGNDWRDMLHMMQKFDFTRNQSLSQLDELPEKTIQSAHSIETIPTIIKGSTESLRVRHAPSVDSEDQKYWIEETFTKRECCEFISSSKDPDKCGCGKWRNQHIPEALQIYNEYNQKRRDYKWSLSKHTCTMPTDSFGTIEFQGGPHPYKANYLRLSFDSDPSQIMDLFEKVWQIPPPKLIITVHGGISNFDLQPKLARVFRKGLLKAARTTGAWIITSGINAGVVRHVAAALEGAISSSNKSRPRITCIGIAPWGLLKKRDDFIGQDNIVQYHPSSFSPKGRFAVLNNRNSYYLLVDNGTIGRYGADIILRRQLEGYIVQKQKLDGGQRSVPVVCVLLEGGTCTIRTVLDYVNNSPKIPVVICDGSGRASDLLAFAHQYINDEGSLPEGIRPQLLSLIKSVFGYDHENAQCLLLDILSCVRQKRLITVFRLGENAKQDVDYAILTALLKGHNLKPHEQLSLALAWNRVDIARSDVFVMGQDWPINALNDAMMEALIHNRVDFVRLLLENGVSMQKFLTIERLEQLYNTEFGPPNTLFYIVRDVVRMGKNYRYTLPHIGLAIEKLMGNGYRSFYTSSEFKKTYNEYRKRRGTRIHSSFSTKNMNIPPDYLAGPISSLVNGINPVDTEINIQAATSGSRALSNHLLWRSAYRKENLLTPAALASPTHTSRDIMVDMEDESIAGENNDKQEYRFKYPFSELLLWAILTKRQDMALCMWEHGEEAMAKALIACRVYKSLAKEAAEDYLEVEICEELRKYADEFRQLSLELLDTCYKHDDAQTLQLLTYELKYWGHETCLSLAVIVNNKAFLAHPCCQILLADLWHGGLRIRSNSNFKVVLGLVMFPSVLFLEFKSHEELKKQPQTLAEHEDEINHLTSSSSESESSSSSSEDDDIEEDEIIDMKLKRKNSSSSSSSNNFPYIFQSRRKKRQEDKSDKTIEMKNREVTPEPKIVQQEKQEPMRKRIRTISYKSKQLNDSKGRDSTEPGNRKQRRESEDSFKKSELSKNFVNQALRKFTHADIEKPPKTGVFKKSLLPDRYGKRQIKYRRKFYEFYSAPITTFWAWCLSYFVFLFIFSYVLLIRTPYNLSNLEYFLISYVIAFMAEMIRKLLMSEPERFREKCSHFFSNYWNIFTSIGILFFIAGILFRIFDKSMTSPGRYLLATSSVFWSIKLLDFFSVHPKFGPLVTMAGKMIQNMTYVVIMLCVSMLAFGLSRQSITYPNEDFHWILVRNIFYKPYFMLYGEVYADEIDTCGDEFWDGHMEQKVSLKEWNETSDSCVPGFWIPPILMTIFLLISNILLISLLIAIFNNIFDSTNKMSQQIWLFQRYRQVMEFESTPFLPPPFTLIYHFFMIIKYIKHRCFIYCKNKEDYKKNLFDFSLKLFLTPDQVEKLHDFEEECMEEYARRKEYEKNRSNEERLHRTAERTDIILTRINDLVTKETKLKANVDVLDRRISAMEERQSEVLDCLRQITSALPVILNNMQPRSTTPTIGVEIIRTPNIPLESVSQTSSTALGDLYNQQGTPASSQNTLMDAGIVSGGETNTPNTAPAELYPDNKMPDLNIPPGLRRHRTSTISGHEVNQLGTTVNQKAYGSILSLDKNLFTTSGTPKVSKGSVRRRHHDEYTSITDTINIEGIDDGENVQIQIIDYDESSDPERLIGIRTEEEEDDEEDEDDEFRRHSVVDSDEDNGRNTPTSTLKRAKRSFIERQNNVLKEYEESVGTTYNPENRTDASTPESQPSNDKEMNKGASTEYIHFEAQPKSILKNHEEDESESSSVNTSPTKQPLIKRKFQINPVESHDSNTK